MWPFGCGKNAYGFSSSSTAEEVTAGIDGCSLTAIVTGATSGIGKETARVLALRGVHVILAVRNTSKGREVKEEILKSMAPSSTAAPRLDVMEIDVSSLASVRGFVKEFLSRDLPLNILINNAGIGWTPFSLSSDGIELQFATNYLGHFLLTYLLLENMRDTCTKSMYRGRIINVSSIMHNVTYPGGIRFNELNSKSWYNPFLSYGQSKLASILHSTHLSRLLELYLTCLED